MVMGLRIHADDTHTQRGPQKSIFFDFNIHVFFAYSFNCCHLQIWLLDISVIGGMKLLPCSIRLAVTQLIS